MAKTKKKETLTPEERLQAALVPESEQPYPVPANWCWTRIGDILRLQAGKNISASKISKNRSQEASFPCFGGNGVRGYVERYNHDGEFPIIGRQGALCGNVNWASGKFYATEHAVVVECSSIISKRWAYRILFSMNLNQYATATAQPGLSVAVINQVPIALPPAQEQQRIVDRIESLFAKLDEAKQKAQDALDSFETRKAAILHKAFTGELTAQWRKEHGVGMESWNSKPLSRVTENHDSERIPLSQAERSKLARVYDYYGASGVIDKVDRFLFEGRKLLIGEDGANLVTRSKPIAFIAEGQYWVNNHAHVLSVTSEMLLDFLCHYINSIDLTPYVTGSAQPKMTQAKMNTIPVPVPTVDEQTEIVRILDDLLAKEQQAKEAAEGVLEQIDLMKKAILARAFRGELGTNDPREESAVELVKTII